MHFKLIDESASQLLPLVYSQCPLHDPSTGQATSGHPLFTIPPEFSVGLGPNYQYELRFAKVYLTLGNFLFDSNLKE